jgi:putative salt-induced outer membrane protein YdiY
MPIKQLAMTRIPSMLRGPAAILVLFLAVACPPLARAETLVLANGDRLSGELVREHEGRIVFRSSVLGEITVAADQAVIEREANAPATEAEAAPPTGRAPEAAAGTIRAATTRAPVNAVTVPVRTLRNDDDRWRRQIELGLTAQDGVHEQSSVSLRLEAARTTTEGSTSLQLSHNYGKSDGLLTADATRAHALLTRNLSDDFFVRGATRFERDPVAGLEHDAEQSLGLGYTLVDRRALQFSLGAGAALRHRDSERGSAGWNGLVDAFGRVRLTFTERLSLAQDFSVSAAPDGGDDYKLKSQTALVNKLTDVLQMTVRYEYEYLGDAGVTIAARQRLVTAIGCVF